MLYDLEADPKESTDISKENPERYVQMLKEGEKILASVESSAAGKDYPEGKVLQPQRGAEWFDMKEYQDL